MAAQPLARLQMHTSQKTRLVMLTLIVRALVTLALVMLAPGSGPAA
jgi:hypothetical protein